MIATGENMCTHIQRLCSAILRVSSFANCRLNPSLSFSQLLILCELDLGNITRIFTLLLICLPIHPDAILCSNKQDPMPLCRPTRSRDSNVFCRPEPSLFFHTIASSKSSIQQREPRGSASILGFIVCLYQSPGVPPLVSAHSSKAVSLTSIPSYKSSKRFFFNGFKLASWDSSGLKYKT